MNVTISATGPGPVGARGVSEGRRRPCRMSCFAARDSSRPPGLEKIAVTRFSNTGFPASPVSKERFQNTDSQYAVFYSLDHLSGSKDGSYARDLRSCELSAMLTHESLVCPLCDSLLRASRNLVWVEPVSA